MSPAITDLLSWQVLLFLAFGTGALASAIAVVLYPNPVRSALLLVLNLFCVAVLYLLLNAYFLAAVQVIVYAGAIMVLFLFVIMLLNLGSPDRTPDRIKWQQPVAIGVGMIAAGVFSAVIFASVPAVPTVKERPESPVAAAAFAVQGGESAPASGPPVGELPVQTLSDPILSDPERMGTAEGIGKTLYNPALPWLFPFEVTSILLLIAVVGSVVLAKRRLPGEQEVFTETVVIETGDKGGQA
jgi:NADH-quinone oxidoreductase subunit J